MEKITASGFAAHVIAPEDAWEEDAGQTLAILETLRPGWLVVDHYGLGNRWENHVRPLPPGSW